MRVALLVDRVSRKGAGVYEVVRAHSAELCRLGVRVRVFGFLYPGDGSPTGLFDDDVEVSAVPIRSSFSPLLRTMLSQLVVAFAPDIIHTHGLWTGLSVRSLSASRQSRARLVVSPHGMLEPWALARSSRKKWLAGVLFERRHLRSAAFVHALHEGEACAIRDYGVDRPVLILPNGVGPSVPGGSSLPRVNGQRNLLFLGRIHEKKGVFQLVEAFAGLPDRAPGWRLQIAGWGAPEDEARMQALIRGRPEIVWLGSQDPSGRDACYRAADAFILPSLSEGVPMTVLEAWSYALPVLMSDECHLSEAFSAGAAVHVSTDVGSLRQQLARFFALSEEAQRGVGQRGQTLCQKSYQWAPLVRRLYEEYQRVALPVSPRRGQEQPL